MTSYEDERADMRGGAMEKILAKYAGDDSEEREAQRQRQARLKITRHAQASRKAVLKEMIFDNYEEDLIERRLRLGVNTDMGWSRLRRQRDQDHMNGHLPDQRKLHIKLYTPKKKWPGKNELSKEEQELAKAEGDTGGNLIDGTALAKASSKVTTSLPIYNEGLRLHRVVQVSTGFGHTLILTAVGVALSYGNGNEGQLGHGDRQSRSGASILARFKGLPIIGVAAGLHHSCCIAESGARTRIFTFGRNDRGQLGVGKNAKELPRSTTPLLVPASFEGLTRMAPVQVAAGNYHTGIITQSGALYCWGDNKHGQLGIGSSPALTYAASRPANRPGTPRRVVGALGSGARQVDHVAMGAFHTAAVTVAGSVFTCGMAKGGRLGHPGQLDDLASLRCIESLAATSRIVHVDAGAAHTICCDDEGAVFSFGMNDKLQLGLLGTPAIILGTEEGVRGVEGNGTVRSTEWTDTRYESSFVSRHSLQSRGARRRRGGALQIKDQNEATGANRGRPHLGSGNSEHHSNQNSNQQSILARKRRKPSHIGDNNNLNVPAALIPPKSSVIPRQIEHLRGVDIRQVSAGGKHSLFVTHDGRLYSCGKAGANARLGHVNDRDQATPKLVEYFVKKTISDNDKWLIQFRAIFSLTRTPIVEHSRLPAFPHEAATFQGKIMFGNNISVDAFDNVSSLLAESKYANIRRQAINLFRMYDKKDVGYVGPLEIERVFPRLGIFLFDFQVDRMCKKYHKRGGRGSSNNVTEDDLLEYLADGRKDLQSGALHTAWKRIFAPRPPPQLKDGALPEFLKIFERKCELAGEKAPHRVINLLAKPLPAPGKKKAPKKERRRYRKIERGTIDLRKCGLTDKQFAAFLFAQKCVPIFQTIDARQNLISDASIEALTTTLNWQLDVDELNPETLYCYSCHELVEFNRRTVETCYCLHCGTSLYRPRYVFCNLKIRESQHPPKSELKWSELTFDKDCLHTIADRLEERASMSPEEFEGVIWELADEHIDLFAETVVIPLGGAATEKGRRALEEKGLLLDHFHRWVERRIEHRYRDLYHCQAMYELIEHCKELSMDLARTVNTDIQDIIPTYTREIMRATQEAHEEAKARMADFGWSIPVAMPIVYEILFRVARNVYRHYVAANLDCRPDTISSGERYSTIAMESGRVVTIGNQDDLVESFKEEILGNLPSRFRKMAAKERVTRARQHALEQEVAARHLKLQIEKAEADIMSARTSVSLSTRIFDVYSESTQIVDDENTENISGASNSVKSIQAVQFQGPSQPFVTIKEVRAHSNQKNVNVHVLGADRPSRYAVVDSEEVATDGVPDTMRKEKEEDEGGGEAGERHSRECENNEGPANPVRLNPPPVSKEEAASASEERGEEADDDGPASPVRLSPVRHSPLKLAYMPVGGGQAHSPDPRVGRKGAQVPAYVELTTDRWNVTGVPRCSEAVEHARDVLDDPDDFNELFKKLFDIFEKGYEKTRDEVAASTESVSDTRRDEVDNVRSEVGNPSSRLWGTEKYVSQEDNDFRAAREREGLLTATANPSNNQKESDEDEDDSEFDSFDYELEERKRRMQGLDEFDGERRMDEDPVYVFSGGRLSIRKMRIGATDQTRADTAALDSLPRRTFFLDQRPRLRTRDIFGRRY